LLSVAGAGDDQVPGKACSRTGPRQQGAASRPRRSARRGSPTGSCVAVRGPCGRRRTLAARVTATRPEAAHSRRLAMEDRHGGRDEGATAPESPRRALRDVTSARDGGDGVVLDVAALEALLARTFHIGLDVGRGREPVALVRLRLSKALVGAAEAQALAAESLAIERGVPTERIAEAERLALHAAAFNGIPDPVFHLTARAMGLVTGLAGIEPDPRAPRHDAVLDAALQAATGLVQLLRFRQECTTAATRAAEAAAVATLSEAAAALTRAAEAVAGLLDAVRPPAAGRPRQE
jgi:hypothetical protein